MSAPGRWHSVGQRIVYCAPNPTTALLEVLVHAKIDIEDVPVNFRYLEIEAPDALAFEDVDTSKLGEWWRTDLGGDAPVRGSVVTVRPHRAAPCALRHRAGDLERLNQSAAPGERSGSNHPPP